MSAGPFSESLLCEGPHPDHERELMLFGRFVGSWDVEGEMIAPDGTREAHRGEWHFGWVLDGRAIQDVLISPPRAERGADEPFEYGTTLRIYDARSGTWRVTYVTPVGGVVHTLTGGASPRTRSCGGARSRTTRGVPGSSTRSCTCAAPAPDQARDGYARRRRFG